VHLLLGILAAVAGFAVLQGQTWARVVGIVLAGLVAPVLRQQIASGHRLRLLYLLGPQLSEYDGDAAQEEFKFAARHACGCRELCHALWPDFRR
jgi:hypothetical protein